MYLYQSPTIEILEIYVEKGFAGSSATTSSGLEGGLGGSEGMDGGGDIIICW